MSRQNFCGSTHSYQYEDKTHNVGCELAGGHEGPHAAWTWEKPPYPRVEWPNVPVPPSPSASAVTDDAVKRAYMVLHGWEQVEERHIHPDHWNGATFKRVRMLLEEFASRRGIVATPATRAPSVLESWFECSHCGKKFGPDVPVLEGQRCITCQTGHFVLRTTPSEAPARCDSTLTWLIDGEPDGSVQCSREPGHEGEHRQWTFVWNDEVQLDAKSFAPMPRSHATVSRSTPTERREPPERCTARMPVAENALAWKRGAQCVKSQGHDGEHHYAVGLTDSRPFPTAERREPSV